MPNEGALLIIHPYNTAVRPKAVTTTASHYFTAYAALGAPCGWRTTLVAKKRTCVVYSARVSQHFTKAYQQYSAQIPAKMDAHKNSTHRMYAHLRHCQPGKLLIGSNARVAVCNFHEPTENGVPYISGGFLIKTH